MVCRLCGNFFGRGHLKGELKVIERFNEQQRVNKTTIIKFKELHFLVDINSAKTKNTLV